MAERKRKEVEDEKEMKAQKKIMSDNIVKQSDAIILASTTLSNMVARMDNAYGANGANGANSDLNGLQDTVKIMKEQNEQITKSLEKQDERITKQSEQIASLIGQQSTSFEAMMKFMKQIDSKIAAKE